MEKRGILFLSLLILTLPLLCGAKPTESEDETNVSEKQAKSSDSAVKGFAKGVKQVAYQGPKEMAEETGKAATKKPPIVGLVEGANAGTKKLLDNTVKGAYKVATLGTSELDSYEVEEPEKNSGQPTKIKISLPGT